MNRKSLLLVLIVCGLLLSALVTRNGRLLSLALPFLAYLTMGLIQTPGQIALTARRAIAKTNASAYEPLETQITVENTGEALVNLSLTDAPNPALIIHAGETHQSLSLPAGESTTLQYTFSAARGAHTWNTLHTCARDPLGLFELAVDLPAPGKVLVRPAAMQLQPRTLKTRFTLHTAGPISARLAGAGTDFWGIREYRRGDSLRRLNWRLAARHPHQRFTNEYEREEIGDFGLILDARKLTNAHAMESALFERAVSATAALAEHFLNQGNRVSLLVFGESIQTVFPGYGKPQRYTLQHTLAHARPGSNLPFSKFEFFPTRLFPSRSQLIVLSTIDRRDLDTYARLLASGYDVLLISPNPVDFITRQSPPDTANALAGRAARVERALQLNRLQKLGVQVIDWPVDHPLDALINQAARDRFQRRNLKI
ncbi:MAG: DUF58 domain-containing protein [Anaerolineales bacterium]|nr:DUF58 domain-containing protein [Anaerolineales bacterium]